MDKKQRIDELVKLLNNASNAYYGGEDEAMSNYEWDAMFDELTALEEETGYIREDSPTQNVSDSEDDIPNGVKEKHEFPALSLQKSKKVEDILKWAGSRDLWCGLKLDGCTCVATYDNDGDGSGDSVLTKLVTRGNGIIGTNVTYLAPAIINLPMKIKNGGHVVVRGEVLILNDDFAELNATMEDDDEQYANARNLASGVFTMDSSKLDIVRERRCHFVAFNLVHVDETMTSWGERMAYLDKLGFETVPRRSCQPSQLGEEIDLWTKQVESKEVPYPVDGLVITFEDWVYANSGGSTGHHSKNGGFAFKWPDESKQTTLDHIDWSCSVGSITPVAVFDPIQLEGTTVSRASLCNLSEMERLGIGANRKTTLEIIKANKIIPKCIRVPEKEGTFDLPDSCPICHAPTEVRVSVSKGKDKRETKTLHCTNPKCPAKHLKKYARGVGKDGLDIDGLSIKTLMQFVNRGFISELADIFHLDDYKDIICNMEGFGQKSWDNLWEAIQARREVPAEQFIYALCIPLVGRDVSKKILSAIGSDGFFSRLEEGKGFEDIKGIGPEKSTSISQWYQDPENQEMLRHLLNEVHVPKVEPRKDGGICAGITFVITGDVHIFKNRNEFKKYVEENGGAVAGSVSKKTSYLVNNDVTSNSSKNKKAKELGIPIISEDQFIEQFGSFDK